MNKPEPQSAIGSTRLVGQCACPVHHDSADCARIRGGGSLIIRGIPHCECPCHDEYAKYHEDDEW